MIRQDLPIPHTDHLSARHTVGTSGGQRSLFGDTPLASEADLIAAAAALGAASVPDLSAQERELLAAAADPPGRFAPLPIALPAQDDVLGETFCRIRSPAYRRESGATYTPTPIVGAMVDWCADQQTPHTIVDPGVGSGRFLVAAGRRFPSARLIGVELDPVAALLARANINQAGFADRTRIILGDYRTADVGLSSADRGPVLFVGNPPYVRHHLIETRWKRWLADRARELGVHASGLAGLHVYFFIATAMRLHPGDLGCFITSAEWLDVNYGRMVRELFLDGLGGTRLVQIAPTAGPFPDATTTGVISCFRAGWRPKSIFVRRVDRVGDLDRLRGGKRLSRDRFESQSRWTQLTTPARQTPAGFVELGELCRVHRGQVTGANGVWVTDAGAHDLPPSLLFPAVTRAKELFDAGDTLRDERRLRLVIDLPAELDHLPRDDRQRVDRFLRSAKARGADRGYIARNRRAWWAVGLREPAPILATYMARRPPAFVLNAAGARHLNIAHGLYPRTPLPRAALVNLARYLSSAVSTTAGRTYAGGLTKFEPREMERIPVPRPSLLEAGACG